MKNTLRDFVLDVLGFTSAGLLMLPFLPFFLFEALLTFAYFLKDGKWGWEEEPSPVEFGKPDSHGF